MTTTTFRLIGETITPGTYRGVWNGHTITLNGRPWTMVKTSSKVVGWRAVVVIITHSDGACQVDEVRSLPTLLEQSAERIVDTGAKTRVLWWPALELLKKLGARVSSVDLNFKTLDLTVLKGNLNPATEVLARGQVEGGYQIWAPSRQGVHYHIRVVWP